MLSSSKFYSIIIIVGINCVMKVQSTQNFFVFEFPWAFSLLVLWWASELSILYSEGEDGWMD